MENTWIYRGQDPIKIKKFLQSLGMGHRLFNDIKRGDGQFLVDHRPVRPTTKVLPNQPLTVKVNPESPDPDVAISDKAIDIIFEDDNWLVINKPAGMASIPGPTTGNDTLLNRVKGYLQKSGSEDLRPHLITRLDQGTSGLLLIAKNHVAQSMISQQVQGHKLGKQYLAIVQGRIELDGGTIDQPIARVAGQAQRVIDPSGQAAQTDYQVEQRGNGWTLVRAILKTGRTHQIRVHFSSIGHPLLGDHLYGGSLDQIKRQALHAAHLSFTDPFTLKKLSFDAPMPADMQAILGK
ncbi:RluA family pseudouridine synthase [Limosilactobacillus sp.]|uniref:RluA family pseudouridine synthase n=1 Tax=Limosilactobacillus sp. TaxID=2773925 RepID=UPI00345E763C